MQGRSERNRNGKTSIPATGISAIPGSPEKTSRYASTVEKNRNSDLNLLEGNSWNGLIHSPRYVTSRFGKLLFSSEELTDMDVEITGSAKDDLERFEKPVRETFYSKVDSIEKNLKLNATPRQAFDKYLSGNMNPVLQINLGRDYRAWFIEGKYLDDDYEEGSIYCFKVLTKKEAQKLTKKIPDAVTFLQSLL